MKLTFSTSITAADAETRTLTGQIVPFGKTGNTSAGPVIFEVGSITNLSDPSSIKLLMEHDPTRPVGKWVEFSATPTGIIGKAKVAGTQAGNDLLVEAADGLRDGFSIGANIDSHDVKDGVIRVKSATLVEVSAVANPAFDTARISDVAASEEPAEQVEEETSAAAEETPTQEEDTQVSETPTVEVEAAEVTPVAAAAPIYTAPRFQGMSSGDYVAAKVKAAMGDHESALLVQAADDSISTNTGLTLPGHMNEFLVSTFASRPTVDAIGTRALPASGMSFTIPRMGTAPTVATTAEGAAPSETGMTSDYITVDVVKKSGLNRVSFELLERSAPNFGDLLLRELQKAYAKNTDQYVIAELTADGTQATATAGTIAGLQSFIATEGPAAYLATGGDFATELVASSAWWSALINANDTTNRPLFAALSPQNATGNASVQATSANVLGTAFRVDHNISTVGLIDESAFLIAPQAVGIWETPTTQLRVNVLTSGEVEIGLHGYIAAKVLKAGGVRRFNLT